MFKEVIEKGWLELDSGITPEVKDKVFATMKMLGRGEIRAASKQDDGVWMAEEWVKKAILLSFRCYENKVIGGNAYDKVPLKFEHWRKEDFEKASFRVVPGAVVRESAHIGVNCVIMPSFINVGAYVGEGTMIDTWATIGSCAQIGRRCHISGGAGIGGVLEPLQVTPTIIEDGVFIGARSEVAEGVIVEEGAVLGMGVFIGASTKIYNRQTKEVIFGRVPKYSVVVPGVLPGSDGVTMSYAAIIVKQVDEKTRMKTSINNLLRAE